MYKLVRLCNYFYKFANLESDMAHRIMYSVLPTVSDVKGRFYDEGAASQIIVSATNYLIKGTSVCMDELQHYHERDKLRKINEVYGKIDKGTLELDNAKHYLNLLNIITEAFSDTEEWDDLYGGRKWSAISEALLHLCEQIINYKSSKPGSDERADAINGMLVRMNVLDGISHNTGDLLSKLIQQDDSEAITDDFINEHAKLTRMMDSKRLNNPAHVFKSIENELDISLPYKQYIERLRKTPGYYDDSKVIDDEIVKIRKSKAIQEAYYNTKGEVQSYIDQVSDIQKATNKARNFMKKDDPNRAYNIILNQVDEIDSLFLNINVALDSLSMYYAEYSSLGYEQYIELKNQIKKIKIEINRIADATTDSIKSPDNNTEDFDEDLAFKIGVQKAIDTVNDFCKQVVELATTGMKYCGA